MLEFQEVTRKKRPMKAIQLGVNNAAEVAKWCDGKVVQSTVRIMGVETKIPAVKLNRVSTGGKDYITALITFWVVQYPNEFKIYKDEQFQQLFDLAGDEKIEQEAPARLGMANCPVPLIPGDYVFQQTGKDITIPHGVVVQIPNESTKFSERVLRHLPAGTYSRSDFGLPALHTTQDPDAQILGLMSYAAAGNDLAKVLTNDKAAGGLAEILKEGAAQTKAVEEFHKIRQIEEARLHNVGPVEEQLWVDRELVMPEGMGTNTPEHTAAATKFLEKISNQGRISMEDVTDPFHEPPNPTPAGESLEFTVNQMVRVLPTDSDWYDKVGKVSYINLDRGVAGVTFNLLEEDETTVEFSPTEIEKWSYFKAGDKVQVTAQGEWYQWNGVVKFVDHGRDGVVGVAFADDVREYREFGSHELQKVNEYFVRPDGDGI